MTNKKANSRNNRGNANKNNRGNANNNNRGNANNNNRGNANNNRGNANNNNRGKANNNNRGKANNNRGDLDISEIASQDKKIANQLDNIEVSKSPEENLLKKIINPEGVKLWQEQYNKARSSLISRIIFPGASVIIHLLILIYVSKLQSQKCACANSWEKNIIQVLSVIYIIIDILFIFLREKIPILFDHKYSKIIRSISYVIYLYCLYTYTNYLKYTKCRCAITKNKNLYLFSNTYPKIMILIIMILIIIGGLSGVMWTIKILTSKTS